MVLSRSKFHFVGIGGIGMSGLAELLYNMGATISGSDQSENEQVLRLRTLGVSIYIGHKKENVGEVDTVVYSSAIPATNPELIEAKARKIPIISRAEVLSEIMRLKRSIAVAGSHGKTTVTSMTACTFIHAKVDPTVVVGGRLDLIKSNSFLGKGEWLIAEADESDGSFKRLAPEIAIITNIDDDHMDHYGTFDNIQKAFIEFANLIPFYGFCVVMGDDVKNRKLFENFDKRVVFYGMHEQNDFYLSKEKFGNDFEYTIHHNNAKLGKFRLNIPGEHNALNALSAFIVAYKCGIPVATAIEGLEAFKGVDRRFQLLGEKNGVKIYDDYGHHPTEIKAVLQAFREKYPTSKIKVAFQPHRYSRTRACWTEFLTAFENCDHLYLVDIYAAGEAPLEGISSVKLCDEIRHDKCEYIGHVDNVTEKLLQAKPDEVFVTLGAGDIYKRAKQYLGLI